MAIVKMKRVKLLALRTDCDDLLYRLQLLGCLEITQQQEKLKETEWAALFKRTASDQAAQKEKFDRVKKALSVLDQYAPQKTPFLAPLPRIKAGNLFDPGLFEKELHYASVIIEYSERLDAVSASIQKLTASRASLAPWEPLDVDLSAPPLNDLIFYFGTIPAGYALDNIRASLEKEAPLAELIEASTDDELHYLLLVCHCAQEKAALKSLKTAGFALVSNKGISGTAKKNIADIDRRLRGYEEEKKACIEAFLSLKDCRMGLKQLFDRLHQDLAREESKECLLQTEQTVFLDGWVPEPDVKKLEKLLSKYDCAYAFSDPQAEDDVPVQLKNSKLVYPMNMVTEMYSLPSYTGIDPNPLIFVFFTLFFGIMYADIGYGLILIAISLLVQKKARPRGVFGQMMGLCLLCGVTTTLCGAFFGSCFGDAIPVISETFGPYRIDLLRVIDPLQEPMTVLIGSVVLGAVHLIFGMCIKVYLCIRDGHPLDALFDVGSWWLVFAGIAVLALGHGPYVLIAGALALILTQGRDKPTVLGKLMGGLASLYDITSYFSDVLSYTRLMALLLATSVIAQVVNILGTLPGSIIAFVPIFLIGHGFNMAVNIIGTYVHAARLQYLEFFGKFYKDGGRPFSPLHFNTKYVDIIKEEQ